MSRTAVLPVLALVGLLAGCGGSSEVTWTMMPAPVIMKDARFDFTRYVPPEDRTSNVVRVLFATTRAPAPEGAPERFLPSAGTAVRLGVTDVQLGEPGWSFADLVESDRTSGVDALRPARVSAVEEFGKMGGDADQAFIDAIDRQVLRSRTGEPEPDRLQLWLAAPRRGAGAAARPPPRRRPRGAAATLSHR